MRATTPPTCGIWPRPVQETRRPYVTDTSVHVRHRVRQGEQREGNRVRGARIITPPTLSSMWRGAQMDAGTYGWRGEANTCRTLVSTGVEMCDDEEDEI
ncbi:hypothetical protein PSPO01_06652 [Paraphaeosphaeria sporulosa]